MESPESPFVISRLLFGLYRLVWHMYVRNPMPVQNEGIEPRGVSTITLPTSQAVLCSLDCIGTIQVAVQQKQDSVWWLAIILCIGLYAQWRSHGLHIFCLFVKWRNRC